MQIMTEKGLLRRDDSRFKHVFKPALTEEKAQKQLVGDLLERAFCGSAEKLVMRALSDRVGGGIAPAVLPHHRAYGSVPRRFM